VGRHLQRRLNTSAGIIGPPSDKGTSRRRHYHRPRNRGTSCRRHVNCDGIGSERQPIAGDHMPGGHEIFVSRASCNPLESAIDPAVHYARFVSGRVKPAPRAPRAPPPRATASRLLVVKIIAFSETGDAFEVGRVGVRKVPDRDSGRPARTPPTSAQTFQRK